MEIKKVGLKFNGTLKTLYNSKVKYIMLHHTAHPTWTIKETHDYHRKSNGWAGIGYNYFIEKDGTIEEGRGFHIGAGATGYNYNSLHICFAGNFETQTPTKEQIEAGKWLINYLLPLCTVNTKVIGHKDIGNTACPGKNFPLDEFKELKRTTKKDSTFIPYLVKVTASVLNVRAGAGTNFKINTQVRRNEVYTIVEEVKNGSTTWGKLKSGAGYVSLSYVKKM